MLGLKLIYIFVKWTLIKLIVYSNPIYCVNSCNRSRFVETAQNNHYVMGITIRTVESGLYKMES